METWTKELFDLFPRETVENVLTELKEIEIEYGRATGAREELEKYLSERKSLELLWGA